MCRCSIVRSAKESGPETGIEGWFVSSVAPIAPAGRGLLRAVGLAFGIAAVIGDTVGVGIMRTSGATAGRLGRPMLIYFVWLAVGIFVLMVANSFAELATAMPKAGGPYVYVRRAYGEYLGFVSGWGSAAVQVFAVAYLAIASGEFLIEIWPALAGHETLLATTAIVLFAAFNSLGLRASSTAQQLLSLLKVVMLAALVMAAFTHAGSSVHASHAATAAVREAGFVAVVVSMQTVLEVYDGFYSACFFSEETTDPDRAIPRALLYGTLLVIGIYLAVNAALLHLLSPAELGASKLAAADALARVYGPSAQTAVALLALVASLGVLNVSLLLAPRILYSMSRDRLFISSGTYVTRHGVPLASMWLSAAGAIAIADFGGFDTLYTAGAFLSACVFLLCSGALFVLRRREPALRRPYRAFGYPWVPGAALIMAAVMLVVFVLGNTGPSLLALGVVAVTYPLFTLARRRQRPEPRTNGTPAAAGSRTGEGS
jgi:basic amino acid/polyamine antiporter, APA family